MWATDARYLNDSSEFKHWKDFLAKYIDEHRSNSLGPVAKAVFDGGVKQIAANGVFTLEDINLYVMCFSVSDDDLNQWRYYGGVNHGYCLGFDLRGMRPPKGTDTALRFAPCIYDDHQKYSLMINAVDAFLQAFVSMDQRLEDGRWIDSEIYHESKVRAVYGKTFTRTEQKAFIYSHVIALLKQVQLTWIINLFSLATHFKHSAYHSEAEWRLSLPCPKGKTAALGHLRTRTNATGHNVEFVDMPLITYDNRLPLSHIKLGPCCGSAVDLDKLFESAECRPEISKSLVPVAC